MQWAVGKATAAFFSMAHFQEISRTKKDLFLRPPQVYLYGLHLGASFFPVKKSVRNLTGMEALHVTLMCNGLPPFNNGNAWVFYNERNTSW